MAQRAPADDNQSIVAPGLCIVPNPNAPVSGILLQPGTPGALSFTTELHFDAPGGATLGIALPDSSPSGYSPMFSFRKCEVPGCGYDLKLNKRLFVSDSGNLRSIAVGTNGHLFPSFSQRGSEPDLDNFARFNFQRPGPVP